MVIAGEERPEIFQEVDSGDGPGSGAPEEAPSAAPAEVDPATGGESVSILSGSGDPQPMDAPDEFAASESPGDYSVNVEAPSAGGHNAPPRGPLRLNDTGEPIYGERDAPDPEVMRDLGLPFWLAGFRAEPDAIGEAVESGAAGVQGGTVFAFCEESGMDPEIKRQVIELSRRGSVFTDPSASPTGFPFKVLELDGSLSETGVYERRERVCDLGYLRAPTTEKTDPWDGAVPPNPSRTTWPRGELSKMRWAASASAIPSWPISASARSPGRENPSHHWSPPEMT